jgi:glucose/arabinose dehydrogenase
MHRLAVLAILCGCAASRQTGTATPLSATEQPASLQREEGKREEQGSAPTEFPRVPPPDAAAAWVPRGYKVDIVLKDLTYASAVDVDDAGNVYVAEAGYVYGDLMAPARVWRVGAKGGVEVVADQLNGPVNDILWHQGRLFISHRGKISVLEGKQVRDLVTGLPSMGDHHNNQMSIGPDGKLYFGQGTATNSGVVGLDNIYPYLWLTQYPNVHDVPPVDLGIADTTYTTPDALAVLLRQGEMVRTSAAVKRIVSPRDPLLVRTGAFQPFGKSSEAVKGNVKANGTVLRMNLDGSGLEVYAWGFRNPYGVAWAPDGKLYVADLGFDERGSRPIANAPDVLWTARQGGFYGWPDYAAGIPVTDARFKSSRGEAPTMLLKNPPPVEKPWVVLAPHTSPTKIDVARGGKFGFDGDLFVGQFGSGAPVVAPGEATVGPQLLRVSAKTGEISGFFRVKDEARGPKPYAEVATAGPKRPVGVRFSKDGSAMYVADVGGFAAYAAGAGPVVRPFPATGVLWRITRENAPQAGPANLSVLAAAK